MKRNDIVKGVFIIVPMAVLFILYGLWLVLDTPVYVESMILGGVILLLYLLLYIQLVPAVYDYILGENQDSLSITVKRTSRIGTRELLRLIIMLVIGRGIIMLGAFLWSLYLKGYTETVFSIQHIWADHPYAGNIISIANKGYTVDAGNSPGEYYNLLFPPLYSLVVRLISPFYLSSIRAGFFVSNVNAILSGIVLYLLVLHDSDRRSAVRVLWYYSVLPPNILLTCTIPASTFLLLSILCVYCARKKHFVISSLLGAMAALTDRVGIALVIPLLLEFLNDMTIQYRSLTEVTWRFYLKKGLIGASLILVPLGFIIYLVINHMVAGDFFSYVKYYEQLYNSSFALFYRVCGSLTDKLLNAFRQYEFSVVYGLCLPSLLFAGCSLVLMLILKKEIRVSYLAYFMICFPVILSQTGIMDAPRQLFCCFPIIIALTRFTKNRYVDWCLSMLCIIGSIAYLGMYVAGWPVV